MSFLTQATGIDDCLRRAAPQWHGCVRTINGSRLSVGGLGGIGRVGDRLFIHKANREEFLAEVIGVAGDDLIAYGIGSPDGISAGDKATLDRRNAMIAPSEAWLGCLVDWQGRKKDGSIPKSGNTAMPLNATPPPAATRKRLGKRINTGHAVFDTFLPLCRGQRIGLFAGSGVGKSMLLGSLARHIDVDIAIIALIGERGREVRAFIDDNLSEDCLARSVIIASTSDQPALAKKQSAHLAMTTAEYFRAQGKNVLLVFDSLTRYAEAHREIALAAGEPPSLHAFPPSTFHALALLAERAGAGPAGQGDITAIFSVLVAGSDMEEPIADAVRGILDGHVVLERTIAERGRFPSIDVRRSVSRSLPDAASGDENALLSNARALLGIYEDTELIVRAGLYNAGSDKAIDRALAIWPKLDKFFTEMGPAGAEASFQRLREILEVDKNN